MRAKCDECGHEIVTSDPQVEDAWRKNHAVHGGGTLSGSDDFNINEATVEDVLAHAEKHPDQVATLRKAEQDGKARKGVLEGLPSE